jgi:hypothetical protein
MGNYHKYGYVVNIILINKKAALFRAAEGNVR